MTQATASRSVERRGRGDRTEDVGHPFVYVCIEVELISVKCEANKINFLLCCTRAFLTGMLHVLFVTNVFYVALSTISKFLSISP